VSTTRDGREELLVDLETGEDEGSLCELLDRLLHTGVVIRGDVVLSVADLDLVYVGVHVLAASMETIHRSIREVAPAGRSAGGTDGGAGDEAGGTPAGAGGASSRGGAA
jgi:hypothetical protein